MSDETSDTTEYCIPAAQPVLEARTPRGSLHTAAHILRVECRVAMEVAAYLEHAAERWWAEEFTETIDQLGVDVGVLAESYARVLDAYHRMSIAEMALDR